MAFLPVEVCIWKSMFPIVEETMRFDNLIANRTAPACLRCASGESLETPGPKSQSALLAFPAQQ